MDCSDVRSRLNEARARHDARIEAHLSDCVECALLAADVDLAAGAASVRALPGNIEALLDGTESRLRREHGSAAWLRSRRTRTRLWLGAAVALGVPLVFALLAPRVDVSLYPMARLTTIAGVFMMLGMGALFLTLRPLHWPALPPGVTTALLMTAVAAVAIDVALAPAHALHPASLEGTGSDFIRRAMGCLCAGVLIGVPALVVAGLLDRGGKGRVETVVLIPLLAAVAGYLALHLHCPLVSRAHLLAGHASLLPLFAVLFVVLRASRPRRRADRGAAPGS